MIIGNKYHGSENRNNVEPWWLKKNNWGLTSADALHRQELHEIENQNNINGKKNDIRADSQVHEVPAYAKHLQM
jgi:hypothetical protein